MDSANQKILHQQRQIRIKMIPSINMKALQAMVNMTSSGGTLGEKDINMPQFPKLLCEEFHNVLEPQIRKRKIDTNFTFQYIIPNSREVLTFKFVGKTSGGINPHAEYLNFHLAKPILTTRDITTREKRALLEKIFVKSEQLERWPREYLSNFCVSYMYLEELVFMVEYDPYNVDQFSQVAEKYLPILHISIVMHGSLQSDELSCTFTKFVMDCNSIKFYGVDDAENDVIAALYLPNSQKYIPSREFEVCIPRTPLWIHEGMRKGIKETKILMEYTQLLKSRVLLKREAPSFEKGKMVFSPGSLQDFRVNNTECQFSGEILRLPFSNQHLKFSHVEATFKGIELTLQSIPKPLVFRFNERYDRTACQTYSMDLYVSSDCHEYIDVINEVAHCTLSHDISQDLVSNLHMTPSKTNSASWSLGGDALDQVGIDWQHMRGAVKIVPKEFVVYFQVKYFCDAEVFQFGQRIINDVKASFHVVIDFKNRLISYLRHTDSERVCLLTFMPPSTFLDQIHHNESFHDLEFVTQN